MRINTQLGKPITIANAMSTAHLPLPNLPMRSVERHEQHLDRQARNDGHAGLLAQATLLNWLGQAPITFQRIYVDITGSVVSGLWLSYALALAARAPARDFEGDDYVFTMSSRDCEAATGITRGQQVKCRKALADIGLLSEEGGQRKAPTYRLHMAEIAARMMRESEDLAVALQRSSSDALAHARG